MCTFCLKWLPKFESRYTCQLSSEIIQQGFRIIRKHVDKEYHKADELKKTMTNQQPSIESKLNQALAEKVAINRQKLGSIMKIIVLCGRQNIFVVTVII